MLTTAGLSRAAMSAKLTTPAMAGADPTAAIDRGAARRRDRAAAGAEPAAASAAAATTR